MSKVTAYNNKPYPLVYLYTSEPSQDENQVRKLNKGVFLITGLFIIVCIILSGIAFHFYKTSSDLAQELSQGFEVKSKLVVLKLSKITILPSNENPNVDIVTDLKKFASYEFSNDLRLGDYIITYPTSSKVFAYRESSNMLLGIEAMQKVKAVAGVEDETKLIADVNSMSSSISIQNTSVQEEILNIKILNGSKTIGLGTTFQRKLQSDAVSGIKITTVEPATTDNYKSNKIVILKPRALKVGDMLTEKYSLEPIELPESEVVSEDIDILIIIGSK